MISVSAAEWAMRERNVSPPGASTMMKLHFSDRRREALFEVFRLFGFSGVEVAGLAGVDAGNFGHWQRRARVADPARAVFDIAGERTLADVEIHDPDGHAHAQKADAQVHRDGGLARPALFVADNNRVRQPASGRWRQRLAVVAFGSCHYLP